MSSEAGASLAAALQNLNIAWDQLCGYWRDTKRAEFEERFLKELPSRATQASNTIAEIEKILKKVRDDCS